MKTQARKKERKKGRDVDRAGELFNTYHEAWRWTEKKKEDEFKREGRDENKAGELLH